MKVCIGITDGSLPPFEFTDRPWDGYLWRAGLEMGIVVTHRDDLILDVPAYDPRRPAPVSITLRRKGSQTPVVQMYVNSTSLVSRPQLVWMDGYPHVAGVER